MNKLILSMSGGMDSSTLLYRALADGWEVEALSFFYGQRHSRELEAAQRVCKAVNVPHQIIAIDGINKLLGGSSLTTSDIDTPHGHYAAENMKLTVVPNRNMIMLSMTAAYAISQQAQAIGTAVHAGDHFIYPDCRPDFIWGLEGLLKVANLGFIDPAFAIYAPYLHQTKTDIARDGAALGVPYELTYTCYEGGAVHCGLCGACQERKEAFREAGAFDPTIYEA